MMDKELKFIMIDNNCNYLAEISKIKIQNSNLFINNYNYFFKKTNI